MSRILPDGTIEWSHQCSGEECLVIHAFDQSGNLYEIKGGVLGLMWNGDLSRLPENRIMQFHPAHEKAPRTSFRSCEDWPDSDV